MAKNIFRGLVLVLSLSVTSCSDKWQDFENQNIPQDLCGTYYQVERGENYYQYLTVNPDGTMEGIYFSDGKSSEQNGRCHYNEGKMVFYDKNGNILYGSEKTVVEWTSEYLVLGKFKASFLTKSGQTPSFIGKGHDDDLIGQWIYNQTETATATLILNENGLGSSEFTSPVDHSFKNIVNWFTFNEWLYIKYDGQPDYEIWRYNLSGQTLNLYYCDVIESNSNYDYHKDNSGNDISSLIVGEWTIYMDDPSWKTVVGIRANGVCEGTDWYDIDGDNTFLEKDSTWEGTYSLDASGITFSASSVIAGSYTFTSVSSDYFEAADEDGWKIYATKKISSKEFI